MTREFIGPECDNNIVLELPRNVFAHHKIVQNEWPFEKKSVPTGSQIPEDYHLAETYSDGQTVNEYTRPGENGLEKWRYVHVDCGATEIVDSVPVVSEKID